MTPGLVLGLCRNVYCRRIWILLLLVFSQIFYHIINTGTCIFTIDITCCSLHVAPGLKVHDFKASRCSIDSFFMPIRRWKLFLKFLPRPTSSSRKWWSPFFNVAWWTLTLSNRPYLHAWVNCRAHVNMYLASLWSLPSADCGLATSSKSVPLSLSLSLSVDVPSSRQKLDCLTLGNPLTNSSI